jgi:hypothetical protein
MEGFIAFEYEREFPRALSKLIEWYRAGRLKLRTDLVDGLDAFPVVYIVCFPAIIPVSLSSRLRMTSDASGSSRATYH